MQQRKKAEMYPLVENWQASGQSRLEFSKAHGLKTHTFHYWVNKYKKEEGLKTESTENNRFVALAIENPPLSQLELTYPNGVRLQINGQVSSTYLGALIKLGSNV